ncbi:transglutaminase TgpA family protein [Ectothiorhodospira mobilis]|uniref:transglutaminase TgpA family protein n=1 Tax=Ectothiorhodospira mobilis TaxID=195064 RepID=UPI0019078A68|nr:DUF3488 and transglutaminase-like domain-containing protein [Ectothiorhodospira mobilis]MBK1690574.1 transglutaminase [Ectothiorhodospira mobilis]
MSAPFPEDRLPPHALPALAAALFIALAPHGWHQPPWVLSLAALALGWRLLVQTGRAPAPGRWLLGGLTLAATGLVLARYGTLAGRDPGVALLVLMTGLKFLETRRFRDAMLVVFLGYFVVITNFFYSQEIPLALYMVLAVFATTAALVRLNAGDGGQPWGESLRLAGLLLAQALPLMVILFFLFPRIPGPLWSMPEEDQAATTGLSDHMRPGSVSRLLQSEAPAFRVTFAGEMPGAAQRYWRGPVFWAYDGRTWRAGAVPPALPANPPQADTLEHTVSLEPHGQRWLLAMDVPVSAPRDARLTDDGYLVSRERVRQVTRYSVRSHPGAALEPLLSGARRRAALDLPGDAAPRARTLARAWRQVHGDDDAAVVQAALGHFRQAPFIYTLSPPPLPRDAVDQFLFETRAGFCEHYAGAFTVLMRAAGIPARVVTGYQGGTFNQTGDYLLVRQSDAHAWTEVWLRGRGWTRVDPTGAVAPERIESGVGAAFSGDATVPAFLRRGGDWFGDLRLQLGLWRDSLNYYWNGWVLAFGPERQRELLARLGLDGADWRALVGLMTVATGLVLTLFAGLFLWRNRLPVKDPLGRLQARFDRRLARLGLPRPPHEPLPDFARRVGRERPDLAGPVTGFAEEYTRLRYGPRPDPARFARLRGHLRGVPGRGRVLYRRILHAQWR